MIGYLTIDKPDLRIRDYYQYKGYYCGLCHQLRRQYGLLGQMSLTYDLTFVVILLSSLYEEKTSMRPRRCVVHPIKKIPVLYNPMTDYGADMNFLLTYYHFADDWKDEKSLVGLAGVHLFHKKAEKAAKNIPARQPAFKRQLNALQKLEEQQCQDIDAVAGCYGHLMEELFVFRQDQWEEKMRRMGFFLGKYIYILDAFEDFSEDRKKGLYNPLRELWESSKKQPEKFDELCGRMLEMMISECCNAFEQLPCLWETDILRNILYSGVWGKYRKLIKKDSVQKEENHGNESI